MRNRIKKVVSPTDTASHSVIRMLRASAGVFVRGVVCAKHLFSLYLHYIIAIPLTLAFASMWMSYGTKADLLKDDSFLGLKPQTAKTSSASSAIPSPSKTLASAGTGSTATYTYDNEGNRATKTENGKTTYYINKYYEEDSDGATRKFIWANGVKVATIEGMKGSSAPEKVTYHHQDHLGGSNVSTDPSGTVAEVNDYYPYGKSRIEERSNNYSNNYLYTGKELDRSTNLYYYGARYYDPLTGRFTSVDPSSGDITNPQTLNSYSYTANNPLKYTDPTGEYQEDVHYDLTFFLGINAGFDFGDAFKIADEDQKTDTNTETWPWNKDINIREKYHFPTTEGLDNLSKKATNSLNIKDIGQYLHALQDSYSHKNFGPYIGHILFGRTPDKTYNDVDKANNMAADTFYTLRYFQALKNGFGGKTFIEYINESTAMWEQIKTKVDNFNKSKTYEEKIKNLYPELYNNEANNDKDETKK